MERVSGANYLANGNGVGKNAYQDYNAGTGQAGTTPNASALNAIQEEIAGFIEAQGFALTPGTNTQLARSIGTYVAAQLAPYETASAASGALATAVAGLDNPAEVATAIATALTTYAPLKSPVLTGSPTAPAPAANDNSTNIATTSWVWTNIQALVANCIGAVATAAGFAYSFGTNGYFKLPSWLGAFILQWGVVAVPSGSNTTTAAVTFPIAFPTACRGAWGTQTVRASSSWNPLVCGALSQTITGFTLLADVANGSVSIGSGVLANYIAIGN